MQITRNSVGTGRGPSEWFTGAVYVDTVAAPSNGSRLSASSVHFTPGARTAWHTHPNGQTIWATEGIGLATARRPDRGDPPRRPRLFRAGRGALARRRAEPVHEHTTLESSDFRNVVPIYAQSLRNAFPPSPRPLRRP
jgi:hypothetical protein